MSEEIFATTYPPSADCIVVLSNTSRAAHAYIKRIMRWAFNTSNNLDVILVYADRALSQQVSWQSQKNSKQHSLHVCEQFGSKQTEQITAGLQQKNYINPIIFCVEANFVDYFLRSHCQAKLVCFSKQLVQSRYSELLFQHADFLLKPRLITRLRLNTPIKAFSPSNLPTPQILTEQAHQTGSSDTPANLLVLYDPGSTHIQTVKEHLLSFKRYSSHNCYYMPATEENCSSIDFNKFNCIIIHYSVRVCFNDHLSNFIEKKLQQFCGLKYLYIQDDYDQTENTRQAITRLGIHQVFCFTPQQFVGKIFPAKRFPGVIFTSTLTGFIPEHLLDQFPVKPIAERTNYLVYRGRKLPLQYGRLGYEKYFIGIKMAEICQKNGLQHDIDVDDNNRIHGDKWYDFLASGRATLGTETGSNLYDDHGDFAKKFAELLAQSPNIEFNDIYQTTIKPLEQDIDIHELSPKLFEAIILKTALVLFEGQYSNILQPNVHYIPLKKDFSNSAEVINRLQDSDFLQNMVDRTYNDIVLTEKYRYSTYIKQLDVHLKKQLRKHYSSKIHLGIICFEDNFATSEVKPQRSLLSDHAQQSLLTADEVVQHDNRYQPISDPINLAISLNQQRQFCQKLIVEHEQLQHDYKQLQRKYLLSESLGTTVKRKVLDTVGNYFSNRRRKMAK